MPPRWAARTSGSPPAVPCDSWPLSTTGAATAGRCTCNEIWKDARSDQQHKAANKAVLVIRRSCCHSKWSTGTKRTQLIKKMRAAGVFHLLPLRVAATDYCHLLSTLEKKKNPHGTWNMIISTVMLCYFDHAFDQLFKQIWNGFSLKFQTPYGLFFRVYFLTYRRVCSVLYWNWHSSQVVQREVLIQHSRQWTWTYVSEPLHKHGDTSLQTNRRRKSRKFQWTGVAEWVVNSGNNEKSGD